MDNLGRMFDPALIGIPLSLFEFDSLLTPLSDPGILRPQVDIRVSTDDYTITVETPVVTEKDITLKVFGGILIIKGEKH